MNGTNKTKGAHEVDRNSDRMAEKMRESLYERMIRAVREAGIRSFEVESLKLEYRNLEMSRRLGLL